VLCVVALGFPPARAVAQSDPAGEACGSAARVVVAAANAPSARLAFLCLVNARRAAAGAPPVVANRRLRHAAQGHSDDMVARRYFEHTAPGGPGLVTRIRRSGYLRRTTSWALGEALGWAQGLIA